MDEYENFYGTVWKAGDSFVVTIPAKITKFAGLQNGDAVKVLLKRHSVFAKEE